MNNEMIKNYANILPGFELVGYKEVAIPLLQYSVHFLYTEKRAIPILQEFVLNFICQHLDVNDITNLLGLDKEVVEDALYSLYQHDFLNPRTNEITTDGEEYLKRRTIDKFEKSEGTVYINSLTGDIERYFNAYLDKKEACFFQTYKGLIKEVTTETIDFHQMKRYFKDYCKRNEIDENSSLVDIIKLNKKITKYKRLHILIYQNSKQEVRIITIENGKKTDKYESILLSLDNNGQNLMNTNTSDYFNSEKVKAITDFFETNYDSDIDFFDMFNDMEEAIITIPLIDNNEINDYFYSALESKVLKNHKIEVIICGSKYTNSNQENLVNKILKLQARHKFVCRQAIDILPFMCFNHENGCICLMKEISISLQNTTKGITHYVLPLTFEQISYIKTIAPKITECNAITQESISYDIRNKMITLENLLIDVDRVFYEEFEINLICPNGLIDRFDFLSVPMAKNYNSFSVFLNALNKTIIEPIKSNSNNAGLKNFLWYNLKNKFPDLQKQLDKIRVFRNKADHSRLDESNAKLYYTYLNEDNDGYLLEFTPNGYQRIQIMWLDNLERILREIASHSRFVS